MGKSTRIQTPEEAYNRPAEILRDASMTPEEKLKALENWEADEKARLRADDENMAPQCEECQPPPSNQLKEIQQAERVVKDQIQH